jgi:hypothetical protein
MSAAPEPAKRFWFVRSVFVGRDIQFFLVTAVATILIVRSILAATGWPQLGGGKIHFAHLLWGGLGMLIALLLFMAMEGRLWKQLATLSAGIGFGLFIDELGKFITSDSDYFFQPAIAFVYLVFVVLFLVARYVLAKADPSPQAALVNAFDLAKEVVIHDLDPAERDQILALLARCDQSDPVVRDLARIVARAEPSGEGAADRFTRLKGGLRRFYAWLASRRWFKAVLIVYLAALAAGGLFGALVLAGFAASESAGLTLGVWEYGRIVSAGVSAVLIVVGFVRWRRSRLSAYRWFERALLVSLFLTQFFAFYQNQTSQVFALALVLLTYLVLRAMIAEEEARHTARQVADAAPATANPDAPASPAAPASAAEQASPEPPAGDGDSG